MKKKKKKVTLIGWVVIIVIIHSVFLVTRTKEEKVELEPKMDVTTRSVGQPGIEPAKFYLVKGKYWGYDDQYVQFKDAKDDRILDQVALVRIKGFFVFNPDTGYPADKVFDSNFPDWEGWLERFDLVLEEHAKKLERRRLIRERK
jgi:hypothetical protein